METELSSDLLIPRHNYTEGYIQEISKFHFLFVLDKEEVKTSIFSACFSHPHLVPMLKQE